MLAISFLKSILFPPATFRKGLIASSHISFNVQPCAKESKKKNRIKTRQKLMDRKND